MRKNRQTLSTVDAGKEKRANKVAHRATIRGTRHAYQENYFAATRGVGEECTNAS